MTSTWETSSWRSQWKLHPWVGWGGPGTAPWWWWWWGGVVVWMWRPAASGSKQCCYSSGQQDRVASSTQARATVSLSLPCRESKACSEYQEPWRRKSPLAFGLPASRWASLARHWRKVQKKLESVPALGVGLRRGPRVLPVLNSDRFLLSSLARHFPSSVPFSVAISPGRLPRAPSQVGPLWPLYFLRGPSPL